MALWERGVALERLEGMLRGAGWVALVAGEAGIGKSAVVRAFADRCAGRAQVLWGWCDPLVTPRASGPLHDIARQVGGELAAAVTTAGGERAADPFGALVAELDRARQRTVLVIEDAHWADEATLDLLVFLGRESSGCRPRWSSRTGTTRWGRSTRCGRRSPRCRGRSSDGAGRAAVPGVRGRARPGRTVRADRRQPAAGDPRAGVRLEQCDWDAALADAADALSRPGHSGSAIVPALVARARILSARGDPAAAPPRHRQRPRAGRDRPPPRTPPGSPPASSRCSRCSPPDCPHRTSRPG